MKSIASSRLATVYASVPLLVIADLVLALRRILTETGRRLQQAVGPARLLPRLGCVATDGTPRTVPIAFTWNGSQRVMCTRKKVSAT